MLVEFACARMSLSIMMADYLVEAVGDLPYALAGDLHERFLGWVRQARTR